MTRALSWRRTAGISLLVCAACLILGPAGARAQVYFSAFLPGGSGVERAGFEGAGLQTLAFQPSGFADGVALDLRAGRMYWTDTNASVIWTADLNGENPQVLLDDFGAEPLGVAVDSVGGKIYWTDTTGVKRANLSGSRPEVLVKGAARGFIALDLTAARMYWADWPTGTVKSSAIAVEPTVTTLAIKQLCPFGVAVDHARGKLYWLELENSEQKKCEKTDLIRSANLDGSEAQTIVERSGAGFEGGLALDPASGELYWSEARAHDIAAANPDGSAAHVLFSTGEDVPEGLAVETANPHPANSSAPAVEGYAQVGAPLTCNPGTWTGTGPVLFTYEWASAGAIVSEPSAGATYVPPVSQTGAELACIVTAADNIETATATSAAVTVAPLAGALSPPGPPPASARGPLVAGFAVTSLTSFGTSASVPVFTSLPARATLVARPLPAPRRPFHNRRRGAHRRFGRHVRAHAASRRHHRFRHRHRHRHRTYRRQAPAPALTVRVPLAPGRDTIVLRGLRPGLSYRLSLTITTAEGQTLSETALLTVRRR